MEINSKIPIERITNLLEKDEKILWMKKTKINLYSTFISHELYFSLFFFIVFTFLSPIFVIPSIQSDLVFAVLLIGPGIGFITGFLSLRQYYIILKKIKKRISSNIDELKNYESFHIITNKRYIQRDYWNNYYITDLMNSRRNEKKINYIPLKHPFRMHDLLIVPLSHIKLIHVDYSEKNLEITFHLNWDKNKPIIWQFSFVIKIHELNEVWDKLKSVFKIINEEELKNDCRIYTVTYIEA